MTGQGAGSFQSAEAAAFWRYTSSSIDRLVALLGECEPEVRTWTPPAPNANAILGLAVHTLSNAEENILGVVLGAEVTRDRGAEFAANGDARAIARLWDELRRRMEHGLAGLDSGHMGRTVRHPRRGEIAVREVLLVAARHAAEHLGQAELTRDLARAALGGKG